MATEFGDTTPFGIHFDDAPKFYINGNPGQMDAVTRKLEQESGRMLGFDPVAGPNGSTNHVTQAIADQAEQNLLHMITFDPNRTPNFILFANPDYFLQAFGDKTPLCTPMTNAASCFQEESGFAWNHGDFQNQITHTWLGIVGPGVQRRGRFGDLFVANMTCDALGNCQGTIVKITPGGVQSIFATLSEQNFQPEGNARRIFCRSGALSERMQATARSAGRRENGKGAR